MQKISTLFFSIALVLTPAAFAQQQSATGAGAGSAAGAATAGVTVGVTSAVAAAVAVAAVVAANKDSAPATTPPSSK